MSELAFNWISLDWLLVARRVAEIGFLAVLAALSAVDLRTRRLPDRIVLPTLWAGLLLNAFSVLTPAADAALGAVCGYGSLWLLSALWAIPSGQRGAAFGGGDLKMATMIGAWVGAAALPVVLLVAFAAGTLAVLPMVAAGRCRVGQHIPFGPALAAGGYTSLLGGSGPLLSFLGWPN